MITFPEPPRSPMELSWSMFGIRVRVSLMFFVIAGLIAYFLVIRRFIIEAILLDVACMFFAFLFTGVSQGLVYRSYGIRSTVMLQDLGVIVYPEEEPASRLQRIIVALSAPMSSFVLFAAVYYSNLEFAWAKNGPLFLMAYFILYWVSLCWGILGLLPIFPYSCGIVLMEVLTWVSPRRGLIWTLIISIILAVAYIAYVVAVQTGNMNIIRLVDDAFLPPSILFAIFLGLGTLRNYQLLQQLWAAQRSYPTDDYGDRAPWER